MSFNLATMLRESALAHPDRACCYFGDDVLTYGELDRRSALVARGLLDTGLRPSQTVAVQLPNIPEFLFAYFAILKAGLVMVPINPLFTAPEIAHIIRDSRARAIVTVRSACRRSSGGPRGSSSTCSSSVAPRPLAYATSPTSSARAGRYCGHQRRRHRGAALHERHDRHAQGRRAHALPALHELHRRRASCSGSATTTSASPCCRCSTCSGCPASSTSRCATAARSCWCRASRSSRSSTRSERHRVHDLRRRARRCTSRCSHADTAGRDLSSLRVGVSGGAAIPGRGRSAPSRRSSRRA